MKKSTKLWFLVLWVLIVGSLALASPHSLVAQNIKLDVNRLESQGKAVVTATPSDLGHVINCFDGDIYTMMRSANINPAFVQVAFDAAQSIKQIRVFLGEPDYSGNNNSWWVEAADSQADMDSQSGSYQRLVHRRDDVNGVWDTVELPQATKAKIWKFSIERTVGDDYVHIPELELWADDFFPNSSVAGFQLIDAHTDAVITNLLDGAQLNFEDLPQSLAIEVLTNESVGSLRISVNGPELNTVKNESAPPYASFGDDNGDFDGKLFQVGTYTVTATPYSGRNATEDAGTPAQISLEIIGPDQPILEPEYETIDPFLATPVDNAANIIPVLVIRFLPTADGVNLDASKVPDFWSLGEITLEDMKSKIDLLDKRIKFMLEEGSKYHGYKKPNAKPMVGYKVVEYITVYEQSPAGKIRFTDENGFPVYGIDYFKIFERFDVEHYVNDLGVKHIWLWDAPLDSSWPIYKSNPEFFDPADFRGPPESNMSSPTTGDVSNSYQDNTDLPVYDHTYIVFGNNFRRDQKEAVGHNYGHQLERMFRYIDLKDNNQEDLFWQKFVGADENLNFMMGRCGWSHMPPNTTEDYDYDNTTLVESDIEGWRPDGSGEKKLVNVDTWNGQTYNWPAGTGDITNWRERTETYWQLYKMQAFPGAEANIPYQGDYLISDWWNIFANWDEVNNAGKLLYEYEEVQPSGITFRLIDADTDESIIELIDGQSVPVSGLPRNLAIEVLTTEPVGSFKINVYGPGINNTKNESAAPYASFGDDSGDFRGKLLAAGEYAVTATPFSGRNATGEAGTSVEVLFTLSDDGNQQPIASFTADPTSGSAPLSVDFDASGSRDSDGEIVSYTFDFGDGTTTSGAANSHTYSEAGEYTVTLTVADNQSATASSEMKIIVEGDQDLTIAGFKLIDATRDISLFGDQLFTEQMYLSSCRIPESMAIEVILAGAVGSIKIEVEGPSISTSMIEHSAPFVSFGDEGSNNILGREFSPGTYYIAATAYSGRDATGTSGATVELELEIEPNDPPSSNFTATPTSGTAPLEITFVAELEDSFGEDYDYHIDFGDGRNGITSSKVSHTYTEEGTYTAVLTVTDITTRCYSSTSQIITVAPNSSPIVGFRLIDADTDQLFKDITQGSVVSTYKLPESLAIEALVSETVGSLRIEVTGSGISTARNQSDAPYSSFGDAGGDFKGEPFDEGAYTVKAIPYSERNGKGIAGEPLEVAFEIVTTETYIILGVDKTESEGELADYRFYVNGELQDGRYQDPESGGDAYDVAISPPEIETLMIEFYNDLQTETEDRNLNVFGGSINFEKPPYFRFFYEGESVVYDRGALDGIDVVSDANGFMDVNGTLIFTLDWSDYARFGSRVTKPSPVAETSFADPTSSELEEGSLLVYPNPARSQIEVSLPLLNDQPYTLQLYDLYGREVFRKQGTGSIAESIPLQGQPRGTYLVAVQTAGKRIVKKLLLDN